MGRETLNRTTLVDDPIRTVSGGQWSDSVSIVEICTSRTGLTFHSVPIDVERGLTIGRNPPRSTDLRVEDHKMSRKHALIKALPELSAFVVRDLKSTNGTFLNGVQIDREFVGLGDVIRTGNSLFTFCPTPPENEPLDGEIMIGCSRSLRDAISSLHQVAPTDLKVLITGDTGTGKELAAHTLHLASGRSGAFVPVNCGSFPESLIESELFGYVKGAFSGAERSREGLIASAHKGTLFLDEIGEFPLALQPRLLRVLQDHEVRPVGATTGKTVDVRFVAATNRDIHEMVDTECFRRDLLARLNEWPVHLAPLCERREDIPLLIAHFLKQRDGDKFAKTFNADLLEYMLLNEWLGNVRELAAAVARLTLAFQNGITTLETLLRQVFGRLPAPLPIERTTPEPPDAEFLQQTIALFEGNISGVARYFGKERQQVYRWMERFNIKAD